MKCPNPDCGLVESKVKKTLIQLEQMGGPPGFDFGDLKMRIRECLECGRQFETFEIHREVFEKKIGKVKPTMEAKKPPPRRPLRPPLDFRRSIDD